MAITVEIQKEMQEFGATLGIEIRNGIGVTLNHHPLRMTENKLLRY